MKHIIKQILKEQITDKVINKTVSLLEQNKIKPPYFKNLKKIDLSLEEIKIILEKFTNGNVNLGNQRIVDKRDNVIYIEYSDGKWWKYEYNERGDEIYYEDSNGFWAKREYDKRGNEIYLETSSGFWEKREYDERGNLIYHENSVEGITLNKR